MTSHPYDCWPINQVLRIPTHGHPNTSSQADSLDLALTILGIQSPAAPMKGAPIDRPSGKHRCEDRPIGHSTAWPANEDHFVPDLTFGDCSLDLGAGELRRKGRPIETQPKTIALLRYLIERRHRVVSKNELFDDLWPGQVVTDGVLKSAVHALRLAVGDDGKRQEIIQTRSRCGYRFVALLRKTTSREEVGELQSVFVLLDDLNRRDRARLDELMALASEVVNRPFLVIAAVPENGHAPDSIRCESCGRSHSAHPQTSFFDG